MVFKMITSGKHVKKLNGKFLKDQEFNLDINPNGQNKIFLKTQELDNGKNKIYKNAFNSMDDFMRDFNNNNNSLFELNKNIARPRYVTPKHNKNVRKHNNRFVRKFKPGHKSVNEPRSRRKPNLFAKQKKETKKKQLRKQIKNLQKK